MDPFIFIYHYIIPIIGIFFFLAVGWILVFAAAWLVSDYLEQRKNRR